MMQTTSSVENVIVGGGIIGLSIAYELAKRGQAVTILEQGQFGRQASWAGAGILTPANFATAIHGQEQLEAISHDLHEQWAAELRKLTGIDNGFRKCGGLYVARTIGEVAALNGMMVEWKAREIDFEQIGCESDGHPFGQPIGQTTGQSIESSELDRRFPFVACSAAMESAIDRQPIKTACWVPGESQFSNPDHLDALVKACQILGVVMKEDVGQTQIEVSVNRIERVTSSGESICGDNYFLAAGPWTERLVEPTGVRLPMQPVRGQIALYRISAQSDSTERWPIINEGSRYLVPRSDGHVLAGATIEEVGFDCRTTDQEVSGLRAWAESLCGELNQSSYVKSWAGLRPGTYDGFAYLGRLGRFENAFVATGHFKSGLQLSTGTAVVIADLAEGKLPEIDLAPFSPARAADHQSTDIR